MSGDDDQKKPRSLPEDPKLTIHVQKAFDDEGQGPTTGKEESVTDQEWDDDSYIQEESSHSSECEDESDA